MKVFKLLSKIFGVFAAIYAVLFAIFYFDLDGKLMYYVVEPFMVKRFDNMKRANITDIPYATKSED